MEQSESIAKLSAALARAQAKTTNAPMTRENPHFRSKYAPLDEVLGVSKQHLAAEGVSVLQVPDSRDGAAGIAIQIACEGEWMRWWIAEHPQPQKFGSFVTYLRRYSLAGLAAIAAEEDDDANEAQRPAPQQHRRDPAPPPGPRGSAPGRSDPPQAPAGERATAGGTQQPGTPIKPSSKQLDTIFGLAEQRGIMPAGMVDYMKHHYGVDGTAGLTGGKGGTASALITALIAGAVERWLGGQVNEYDLPPEADAEGDTNQGAGDESDIPF